jgi:hypothetical protein
MASRITHDRHALRRRNVDARLEIRGNNVVVGETVQLLQLTSRIAIVNLF